MKKIFLTLTLILLIPAFCFAQGFGFEDEEQEQKGSLLPFTFDFSGVIKAGPAIFVNDFKSDANKDAFSIWDIAEARTNFDINGKNAQVFISLDFSRKSIEELKSGISKVYAPGIINEMWLRGYFDRLNVQAGLMKLRWGRMYTPGPLDIVNPIDYSDLTNLTETKDMKFARPMVHASLMIGSFTGIEAVFLPNFAGHKFAQDGRWAPSEYSNITSTFSQGVLDRALEKYQSYANLINMLFPLAQSGFSDLQTDFPDTSTIDYFQTGLRLNTVIGSGDFGFQYFYGNNLRPSVSINGVENYIDDLFINNVPPSMPPYTGNAALISPHIEYSRYHQIGIDYSQVLFGFTVRAEFAYHITGDYSGKDGNVKNPFLAWSFGFDRDIFAGININFQCNETIRLLNDKIDKNPAIDSEGGDNVTSTRLILQLTKNFLRDKLECKLINIWDIENSGCVFIPSAAYSINDARVELSSGIFAGDKKSELGQYRDNSYIKLKLIYTF